MQEALGSIPTRGSILFSHISEMFQSKCKIYFQSDNWLSIYILLFQPTGQLCHDASASNGAMMPVPWYLQWWLCHASLSTTLLFNCSPSTHLDSLLLTLNSMQYHMMHGFLLKIETKTQDVLTYICRFILVMVVDSSANYAKWWEKDPKGPYAINTCLTKLPSKQTESLHALKLHWPSQKALINKLYVLLNYLKIPNNLLSCQTSSKMQLKWRKLTHKVKINDTIPI